MSLNANQTLPGAARTLALKLRCLPQMSLDWATENMDPTNAANNTFNELAGCLKCVLVEPSLPQDPNSKTFQNACFGMPPPPL